MGLLGMMLLPLMGRFLLLEGGGDGGSGSGGSGGSGGGDGGNGGDGGSGGTDDGGDGGSGKGGDDDRGKTSGPRKVEEMSEGELRQELIATRGEAKGYRTDLQDMKSRFEKVETELNDRKKAELSDADRAKKEATEAQEERDSLKKELEEERLHNAVLGEAANQKAVDSEAVFRMIDAKSIKWEDGQPDEGSIKAAVKKVLDEKDYLRTGGKTSPTSPASQGGDDAVKPGVSRIRAALASDSEK
jgi:hypothetical protein